MDTKLLIVDDDINICEMLRLYFENEGYSVKTANDGIDGLQAFKIYEPDLVLLDIMMPKKDGWQVCREIRKVSSKPVIMITAKGEVFDKVLGLELGADDYLAKPFHLAELAARIRSVTRRSRNAGELAYTVGNVSLFESSQRLTVAGKEISLLKKEFDILKYFLMRPGHMVDKAVLAEAVWGDHADQSDDFQYVYAQMKNLRRKLTEAGADIEIKAVYGFGYKLIEL